MTTETILDIFKTITTIPRESGHEEKIIEFLREFARNHNLPCRTDRAGNVLIIKEAAKGKEDVPTVILQSHSDMVCEKNAGAEHDFSKDPIRYVEEEGWLIAKDTTLGADCGIGMAAQLALLADSSRPYGKIEALFTTSEETGMDGAHALESGFMSGKILINLDSEDEGELFIGCAGGLDTTAVFKYSPRAAGNGLLQYRISITGGLGGHSGDDIDKGRANANKLLSRFLYEAMDKTSIELYSIEGGNKRNAIAREASAVIGYKKSAGKSLMNLFSSFREQIKEEYRASDPGIDAQFVPVENFKKAMDPQTARNLICALHCAPHGVLAMSAEMKGLVETSTNLASIKMIPGNRVRIGTSQRSSINSARKYAAAQVESLFRLAGAKVTHESEYPGWKPKLDSYILRVSGQAYKNLFGKEPVIRAIHAGLECGLFLDKFPELDMISFGPTIRGVHAPGERLELASVDKFRKLLEEILANIR